MKKHYTGTLRFLGMLICMTAAACGSLPPEKFFSQTVLNTNLVHSFASNGMARELDSPSAMLSGSGNETRTMKRSEVIDMKITAAEEAADKVRGISPKDEDEKKICETTLQIYDLVLPVYKGEYKQLAGLYDSGAPQDQIDALLKSINDTYRPKFDELDRQLISLGKAYADKHGIKVNWGR